MSTSAFNQEQRTRCLTLGSATLYEASGLNCAVDPQIRPVWEGAALAAPAYPLVCSPGDNLSIHIALERAPAGSVLVVDAAGFIAGYWGEVLTVAAKAAGIAGLVINGGVRDVAAIGTHRFPVFSRGISVRGTVKASSPSVGQAMLFAGAPVALGDLVVADADGVIILPAAAITSTLQAAEARAEKENIMMQQLRQGVSTLELMGLSCWRERA
ncbi:RraA family protein [Aquitalea aquatica]|uniref:Dimethylmenaquinone methyltransferase n=1 Tax=Aquitalea aquatica TaxID=3044273 RepID=A0A838YFF1_9NEIS|nr:dimethylmenaquinone methyltransferase [Aquitalea magnusonii]MBA4709331.1 dimethylmenaquinone methyltransferase [Aquitalea magnusonii]